MAKGDDSVTNGGLRLNPWEVVAFLERYDLGNRNAGRVFNVSAATIKIWSRQGANGAAAQFITYLMKEGIPPHYVAERLGVRLTRFGRGLYDRVVKPMPVKGRGAVSTHELGGMPLPPRPMVRAKRTVKNG